MSDQKRHWAYGRIYKNGKLYAFDARRLVILSEWPDLRTWYKTPCKPWVSSRKRADDVLCDLGDNEHILRRGFLERKMEAMGIDTHVSNGDQVNQFLKDHLPILEDPIGFGGGVLSDEYAEWKNNAIKILPSSDSPYLRQALYLDAYFQKIPDPVRVIVNRISTRKWHMLCLLARVDGAMDLCKSNLALAYALASSWVFKSSPVRNHFRSIRAVIFKKQRRILRWLDFPDTALMNSILKKVNAADISVPSLLKIRQLVSHGAHNKLLSHLAVVDGYIANMLLNPVIRDKFSVNFFEEFSQLESKRDLFFGPSGAIWLISKHGAAAPKFSSLKSLNDYCADLRYREKLRCHDGKMAAPFPSPPFSGCQDIQPIQSYAELVREGLDMKNCVESYLTSILAGEVFVYKVTSPFRATVSVVKQCGCWLPGEAEYSDGEALCSVARQQIFESLFDTRSVFVG